MSLILTVPREHRCRENTSSQETHLKRPARSYLSSPLAKAALVWHHDAMLKPIKQGKRPAEVNQFARHLVDVSTQEYGDTIALPTKPQISLLMAELGRKGGKIGGKRRMDTMTAKERTKVAKKAAAARWSKGRNN
jgi:hypothetical protein